MPKPSPPPSRVTGTPRSSSSSSTTCAFRRSRRTSIRSGRRTATSSAVIRLAEAWVRRQPVRGLAVEIVRLPGRTPVLWFEVPAAGPAPARATVLLYGHLDKQPEMTGWRDGLGPWLPVIEDGKLYGRGGADDGYAVFASLAALAALQAQGVAARALRRPDRDLRGKRQLRPAGLPRRARAADRPRRFRRRPRFGLRRLRAAVGDDVAARPRRRHADRRRADRGRALGRRERHRAVVVPHRARSCSTGWRTRRPAAILPAGVPRADSRRAPRAGGARRQASWATWSCASTRSPGARSRWPPTMPRRCSTARGGRRCR